MCNASSGQFERLRQLAAGDATGFVHLRRSIIAELIEASTCQGGELAALQNEIDCHRALAPAPQQALDALMQLLEERVAELQQLAENLSQLQTTPQSR